MNEFNVRQPIVSKRIKEVEDELGVRSFERSTVEARLAPLGEDFVVDARRVLDETEQMTRHAKAGARYQPPYYDDAYDLGNGLRGLGTLRAIGCRLSYGAHG